MTKPEKPLAPLQARFVAEYLIDLNGKQAAIRAGYAPKAAEVQASKLLRIPKVRAAVEAGKAKQIEKADLSATRILEELRRIALFDPAELFEQPEKGSAEIRLKPITELAPEVRSVLTGWGRDCDDTHVVEGSLIRIKIRILPRPTTASNTVAGERFAPGVNRLASYAARPCVVNGSSRHPPADHSIRSRVR